MIYCVVYRGSSHLKQSLETNTYQPIILYLTLHAICMAFHSILLFLLSSWTFSGALMFAISFAIIGRSTAGWEFVLRRYGTILILLKSTVCTDKKNKIITNNPTDLPESSFSFGHFPDHDDGNHTERRHGQKPADAVSPPRIHVRVVEPHRGVSQE